ncbi:MAG: GNAT family N-acetyltransferase [Cyanobacteria bacterium P01_H01_bin.15]
MTKSAAKSPELKTARLWLRRWQNTDLVPFARLNVDPRVMKYFPNCLSRAESDALIQRIETHFTAHGFGLWAAEIRETQTFIGFVGLAIPIFTANFTPCVEIGWRLAAAHWGQGYATEAARAALEFGFSDLGLPEIVSFTVPENLRSRNVMRRLGMHHNLEDDFEHPLLPVDDPLRSHVLYRLRATEYYE